MAIWMAGTGKSTRARTALAALLLLAIVVTAYIPALRAGYIWDDPKWVLENKTLRSLDGLRTIWFRPHAVVHYYPLVFTTFWIEYHLWGLAPFGYHLVNVLLHAGVALLLWRTLRRLHIPGAWLAAAVFALHPVHVESVAWVTERKNVLQGVFYVGAVLAYLKWALPTGASRPARRWWLYGLSILLFVCALLSKTVACTLPALLLVLLWWKRDRLRRNDVLALVPLFVVGLGLALLTILIERRYMAENPRALVDFTFIERCLIAGRALWFYVGKLLLPVNLTHTYPRWEVSQGVWWQYLYPLVWALLLGALWAGRRRWGRAPVTAAVSYMVMVSPALGFFDYSSMNFSLVADHFLYLASAPLIALGVGLVTARLTSTETAAALGRWMLAAPAFLLALLSVLTWQQARVYRDLETLWRDTLAKNPNARTARHDLGLIEAGRGNFQAALEHLAVAVELQPDHPKSWMALGDVHAELARLRQAAYCYRQAIRAKPDEAMLHHRLGLVLYRMGRPAEAAAAFEEALRLQPRWVNAMEDLARLRITASDHEQRNPSRAVELARHANEISGYRDARLLALLARALAADGQPTAARRQASRALGRAREDGQWTVAAEMSELLERLPPPDAP